MRLFAYYIRVSNYHLITRFDYLDIKSKTTRFLLILLLLFNYLNNLVNTEV